MDSNGGNNNLSKCYGYMTRYISAPVESADYFVWNGKRCYYILLDRKVYKNVSSQFFILTARGYKNRELRRVFDDGATAYRVAVSIPDGTLFDDLIKKFDFIEYTNEHHSD